MNRNQKTGAMLGGAFIVGVYIGEVLTRRAVQEKLNQKKQLIMNGLVSAVTKAMETNMTAEEFAEELNRELEFLHIVTG